MSFKKLNFEVPNKGLHFIGGEVEGTTMSNSNGAGKSSIPEALCFGLFGKTVRNAGKDDIVNRSTGKDCVVAVVFQDEAYEYTVFRFRGDTDNENELRLMQGDKDITASTTADTQEMIDHILGMNWLVFSNAVIFGENARRFTQAKDSEKKQVFDEIMLFHQYVEAQSMVKDEVKSLKVTLDHYNSDTNVVLASIQNYQELLEEEKVNLDGAKERQKSAHAEIENLKNKIHVINAQITKMNAEMKKAIDDRASLNEDNETLYESMVELNKKSSEAVRELKSTEDEHNLNLRALIANRNTIEAILEAPEKLPVGTRCPKCKQPITEESIDEVKEHFKDELDEVLKAIVDEEFTYKTVKEERELVEANFEKEIEEVRTLRHEYDEQLEKMSNKIRNTESNIKDAMGESSDMETEIKMISGYSNNAVLDIEERMKQTTMKLEPLQEKLLKLEQDIQQVMEEITYHEFWVEGFGNKGIKSFLLDEVVPELNKKANFYASMLMDEEVQIEFKTESTLRSGETRDKFNVGIVYGGEEVAYENCSSGEKGRIDVSILLALQNLIFSRNANNSNLVIFDEVFEHLDITGVERVVNLLREEADDKAILVISHQNELRDYFDNQILVVKDENGVSRVEQ